MNVLPTNAGGSPVAGCETALDEVGDRLGVAEAVRVVGGPVLDHHRDPPAELLVDVLDDEGVVAQDRIEAAADVQHGHVGLGQSSPSSATASRLTAGLSA